MEPFYKLGVTLILVVLNGFFVAAEFAIVRVRQTRINEMVEQGNAAASTVSGFLSRLDTYLSATQLGVTLASLGLGAVGEPAMASVLYSSMHALHLTLAAGRVHTIAILLGFIVITTLHIIFGELLPKWYVIANTERTAMMVAGPMKLLLLLGFPLIKALESTAQLMARLLNIDPGEEGAQAHSEDEILAIIRHSHREGELRPSEIEIAENVFHFAHTQAREIMVPRVDIVTLSTTWSIGRNVEVAVDNGFTRYPLCDGDRDHIVGMIHIKDLLSIAGDPAAQIGTVMRQITMIPETKPIDELLKELQKSHSHQAVVLDEYGGTAGLVTLEDILEELVGEIQDEHDEPPPLQQLDENGHAYSVAGTVAIEEVSETLGVPIDNPDSYETIGGFLLHELRLAPRMGARTMLDAYSVVVSEVTGRRIRRLLFTRTPPETPSVQEAAVDAK